MNRILSDAVVIAIFVGVVGAFAVASGDEIHWRSGTVGNPVRTAGELKEVIAALAARRDARHVVVQFDHAVSPDERTATQAAGLKLLSYLGDNAFFASLVPDADSAALSQVQALKHVEAVQRQWRLHAMLAAGKAPEWAIVVRGSEGNPTVGAYVLMHGDVPAESEGVAICQRHGAVVRAVLRTVNGLVIELRLRNVTALADEDAVQWIEPPLPRLSEINDSNRALVQANMVQAPPYGLDGAGITVLVYDGGTALATHPDFGGRLFVRDNSGLADHATHVSGTIGGNGAASGGRYRGMAPGVLIESYGLQTDGTGIFLYTNPGDIEADYNQAIHTYGANIANNSIGTNIVLNGLSCDLMGNYGVTDMVIDSIVRGSLGAPFRVVWANGNERQAPATCGTTYHTTGPPACAKNHITVGAVNSNDDSMTSFSSWGPTDDGRIKPDVSAPGCQTNDDFGVTSCSSSGGYVVMCGTSMAAPTVTGCCALLLQDYRTQFPMRPDPRNSTLKVLLAQSAVDRGNVGPDYQFGYGSVRIQDAIDFMRSGQFTEDAVSQAQTSSVDLVVNPGAAQLKVTLAWDDWPGTPNVIPSLVNDLDLRVFDPSNGQHFPWTLDPANPSAPAVRTQADHKNNIEQVVVDSPVAGVWRVEVYGFNVPLFPQTFSLCASHPFASHMFTEAISRAYTVVNLTDSTPPFSEAVSRAYTVANLTDNTPVFDEAISPAYTVINLTDSTPLFDEGLSRAYTVINLTDSTPVFDEVISRAVTVANRSGIGDLNCDGVVDFADIDPFVLALSDPAAYQAAYPNCNILNGDCNCDGVVNFEDIDPFVALLSG